MNAGKFFGRFAQPIRIRSRIGAEGFNQKVESARRVLAEEELKLSRATSPAEQRLVFIKLEPEKPRIAETPEEQIMNEFIALLKSLKIPMLSPDEIAVLGQLDQVWRHWEQRRRNTARNPIVKSGGDQGGLTVPDSCGVLVVQTSAGFVEVAGNGGSP